MLQIIAHHHHRRRCHCRQVATASTNTTWSNSPLPIAEERGNSSSTTSIPTAAPTSKRFHVQMTWTYLTYLQYFHPLGYVLQHTNKLLYLQFVGDPRRKILVPGEFLCWHRHACWPKIGDISTLRRHVANMPPTFPAKVPGHETCTCTSMYKFLSCTMMYN